MYHNTAEQAGLEATLRSCIPEILGSNMAWETGYLDFHQSVQTNAGRIYLV
jgi:hypothetical protein